MTKTNKLIAIENTGAASGLMTYWNMAQTTAGDLAQAAQEEGVDESWLPGAVGVGTALGRALRERTRKGYHLAQEKDGAWIFSRTVRAGIEYAPILRARPSTTITGDIEIEDLTAFEEEYAEETEFTRERDSLRTEYLAQLQSVTGGDLGLWLSKLVQTRLDGVALRRSGGIYYVPIKHREVAEKIERTLAKCGGVVYQIPAMHSEGAAKAVLDAIAAEAQDEIAAIVAYLEEHSEAGKRALKTRQETLEEVRAKLGRYESTFGANLGAIHNSIAQLHLQLASAVVAAEEGVQGVVKVEGAPELEIVDAPKGAPMIDPTDGAPDLADRRAALLEIDAAEVTYAPTNEEDAFAKLEME